MPINFDFPQAFTLLLLVPILTGLYFITAKKRPAVIRFSSLFYFKKHTPEIRVRLRHLPFILRMLSLILLIIILAGPISTSRLHNVTKEGINIIIALDISSSMKEQDLSPNRLEVAKKRAEQFIIKRQNDRIGLIIFGSEAFLQCPLTLDHQMLSSFVRETDFIQEISSQTALGNAIAMSVIALLRGENTEKGNVKTRDLQKKSSQVIVLITDGRNTSTEIDPLTAAQIAQTYGIKIYTIGIGRPHKPLASTALNQSPSLENSSQNARQNTVIQSLIDEKTLSEVASGTGGRYFNVQNNRALELTFEEIDRLEKTTFYGRHQQHYEERYMPFAYMLITTIILEILIAQLIFRKRPA